MRNFILLFTFLCITSLYGQDIKRPDSYNYTRGVEAIQNDNIKEALEYFNKEIEDNPNNGYAFSWLAFIRNYYKEEFGGALLAADRAVKLLPKEDEEFWTFTFLTRAEIFKSLEKNDYAIQDYNQILKDYPENIDALKSRAQLYFLLEQYDNSDKDYRKLISLERGNTMGYMGIGRNANAQKKYDYAIEQYNYVIKLAPEYSTAYSLRAVSYIHQEKWYEAVDDIITALSIDYDNTAFEIMQSIAEDAYEILDSKLKIQKLKNPNDSSWPIYLGLINELTNRYVKAVAYYKESFEKESSSIAAYKLAYCLDEIGEYSHAKDYCLQAIKLDSTDYNCPLLLAEILDNAGQSIEAIHVLDDLITKEPDSYFNYYRRGWIKEYIGEIDGAIDDYSMSIAIMPNYAYTYLNRGVLLNLKGETAKAKKDFEQVIKLDSVPDNAECSFYAYYYLGNKKKAIEIINKILDNKDKGKCYEAACLFSIMGDKEKALQYLESSLSLGYNKFNHIMRDHDLKNIRNTDKFKDILNKYQNKSLDNKNADNYSFINRTIEIPFTKENGLYKVKCSINNLPLYFVFDTGASHISISSVEATFMLKNSYIQKSDIIGKQNYLTASGNLCEGTTINLHSVDIGGLKLQNIRATVVHNQQAPLLLGQSVLNRLGTIEIDNSKQVLKVTYTEKIKK